MRTILLSGISVLFFAGSALAHPGHGAGGPPSTVTMGPPSAAFDHVPNGVANGHSADAGAAADADELGSLNAAHASAEALAHASSKSMVGAIAAYKNVVSTNEAKLKAAQAQLLIDQQTLTNLQNSGTATQQQLTTAQNAVNADLQAISQAQAAILAAQNTLALRANKPLTPQVIAQLNAMLGL